MGRAVSGPCQGVRKMACALLLRRRQETVTSAWIWNTGFVFRNRCRHVTSTSMMCSQWHRCRSVICLSNIINAGHLLSDQPPHRHSDGGKSGKSADGKYCLWGRTLYQEYRLQQGQKVFLFSLLGCSHLQIEKVYRMSMCFFMS